MQNSSIASTFESVQLAHGEFAWRSLGQQSFLLKFGETLLAVDPYLAPSPSRLIPPMMSPEQFSSVTAIFGTHLHSDHIDLKSWPAIAEANPALRFVAPQAVKAAVIASTGIDASRIIGMTDGDAIDLGGVTIHAIPSAHEMLDRDPVTGCYPYLGYIFEANGVRIYHAGDTCRYDGMIQKLRPYLPLDAAMLPINGRDAERLKRNCIGNMTYQEAADLAGEIRPRLTIPAHFDMFPGNTCDPALFADYMAAKYPSRRVTIPVPGTVHHEKAISLPPSCIPQPKLEEDCYDWHERHREKCAAVKGHTYDILLLGDSLTHFWETKHGHENWQKTFANHDVLNLGFGWDRTCNVLYRLQNGELVNQNPKLVSILIGTNNFSQTAHYPGDTPEQIAQGIQAIIDLLFAHFPNTHIVLMCVFPRGLNKEGWREKITHLNELLREICRNMNDITLIDLSDKLMKDGELNSALYRDGTHLQEGAYDLWSAALLPVFDQLGV